VTSDNDDDPLSSNEAVIASHSNRSSLSSFLLHDLIRTILEGYFHAIGVVYY
jgi:hypothetical protein